MTSQTDLTPRPVPLGKLRGWDQNPRRITKSRFEQLQRDMRARPALLEARPLVATPDGTVIMGNMRLRAAREMGWPTLPVVTVDLSPSEARAWAVLDNQGYGEWEDVSLAELLAQEREAGVDITTLGFTDEQLEMLLGTPEEERRTNARDVPTPSKPKVAVSSTGELWALGPHRLLIGDFEGEGGVERARRLLDGQKVGLALFDPPYGVKWKSGRSKNPDRQYDVLHGDDRVRDFGPALSDSLRPDSAAYIFCSHHTLPEFRALYDARLRYKNTIIWDKGNHSVGDLSGSYASRYEMILYYHHGRSTLRGGRPDDILEYAKIAPEHHPTQKPVDLLEFLLERSSDAGDMVVDLTVGSGQTIFAAEASGRVAYAGEIDPGYADVVLQRWALYSQHDPAREDGKTYGQLVRERNDGPQGPQGQ